MVLNLCRNVFFLLFFMLSTFEPGKIVELHKQGAFTETVVLGVAFILKQIRS